MNDCLTELLNTEEEAQTVCTQEAIFFAGIESSSLADKRFVDEICDANYHKGKREGYQILAVKIHSMLADL